MYHLNALIDAEKEISHGNRYQGGKNNGGKR